MTKQLDKYFELNYKLEKTYADVLSDESIYYSIMDEIDDVWNELNELEKTFVDAVASYDTRIEKIKDIEEGLYDEE